MGWTKHHWAYDAGVDIGRNTKILIDVSYEVDATSQQLREWKFDANEGGYNIATLMARALEHSRSCKGC